MTIIKRADLGRPLTWDELDDNFQQVDDLTAAASAAVSSAAASATAAAGSATNSFNSANSAASSADAAAASAASAIDALMNSTFEPSDFDFASGGTLDSTDRNKAVYNPADNNWYSWAGTLPHVVAAGTNPTADSNWKPRTDQLLRQNLGSSEPGMGASLSTLEQGGTVQDALKSCVSVFAHGAKGDFNPTTKTGTDDTQAFKDAISYAISHGLRNVYVPAGHYLITDELNIGGQSFLSGEGNRDYWRGVVDGVHIFGDGPYSTILVFDPPTSDTPCLSARGGWGTHSPRAISQLAIEPLDWVDYSSTAEGTGVLLQGCCFVPVTDVNIGRFHRGVHLWNKLQGPSDTGNTFASGDFTEFNRMTRVRIFNCDINSDYQVTKGNNSFHGNSWRDCMFQINPYGGIGLRMWDDGTRAGIVAPTDPRYQYIVNVYNNNFDINFFGSDSQTCYLMSLIRAQGRGCSGTMTVEAAVTLKTDTYEWFQSFGSLHSISAVNTSVGATDKATRPVAFIWNNLALPENYFDGADSILLSTSYPRQFDLNNYGNTGMDLLNVRGGQSGNIWSQQYSPVSVGWLFTVRDQSVSRPGQRVRWQFSYDGTKIKAPAQPKVGLYNSTVGIDITATAAVPSATATIDLGSSLLRYKRCYFDGWDISSFGVVPTADASFNAGSSSLRINRSYVVSRYYTATVFDSAGAGSPEGVVAAGTGSTYRRTDGGAASTFYVKEAGTGNTGWVAK